MGQVAIRVTPRSSRDEIVGLDDGVLHVRVTAPPDDGKANAAVCRVVAGALGVPKSAVGIARGATSRHKMLSVDGMATEAAEAALRAVLAE